LLNEREKANKRAEEDNEYWHQQQNFRKSNKQRAFTELAEYNKNYCKQLDAAAEQEHRELIEKYERQKRELLEAWAELKIEKQEQSVINERIEHETMEDCAKFNEKQQRIYRLISEAFKNELNEKESRNDCAGESYAMERDKCCQPKSCLVDEMMSAIKGQTIPSDRGPNPANPAWFRQFARDLEQIRDDMVQQKIERQRENEKIFKAGMEDMIAMRREQQELREKDRLQRKHLMADLRVQAVETKQLRSAAKMEEALRDKKVFHRLAEEDRLLKEYRQNFHATE
jgi:hypothetical protein